MSMKNWSKWLQNLSTSGAFHNVWVQLMALTYLSKPPLISMSTTSTARAGILSFCKELLTADTDSLISMFDGLGPCKVHDTRVFSNSSIFKKGQNGALFPKEKFADIAGVKVPLFITADAAYPFYHW